jgi:hypothetical protein
MPRLLHAVRRRRKRAQRLTLLVVAVAYCVGATWLAVRIARYGSVDPTRTIDGPTEPGTPIATIGSDRVASVPKEPTNAASTRAVAELRNKHLIMPVHNVRSADLRPSFLEQRGGHLHEALDILAPRGTTVVAVEEGRIARLFFSQAGGHTIYRFDPTERYAYYYAHLDRYAYGLEEGDIVQRGQVIAYVGTSGNAPESTPHLHFAIFQLGPEKRWWQGTPIDPFLVWR